MWLLSRDKETQIHNVMIFVKLVLIPNVLTSRYLFMLASPGSLLRPELAVFWIANYFDQTREGWAGSVLQTACNFEAVTLPALNINHTLLQFCFFVSFSATSGVTATSTAFAMSISSLKSFPKFSLLYSSDKALGKTSCKVLGMNS